MNDSVIGLATNATLDPSSPDYKWVDEGMVLRSQPSDTFNAIDPDVVVDASGVPWLAFGSFWSGILIRRLDPATGKPSMADTTMYPLVDRHWPPNAVEGVSITRHGGYYYAFASFDYCCRGADSDYRVVVGRSVNVTGPYVDETGQSLLNGGGTEVLRGYNEFAGAGGGDVYADGTTYRYVHHYYDITDNGAPKLSIRRIAWSNDWPVLSDPVSGSVQVGHGPAYMKLVEKTTGKLMSAAPGGSSAPLCGYEGANVQLATDSGSPCQQWQLRYAGGYYGVLNRHSNKVVDVSSCGYADGAHIGKWGWLDNDCQKFRFVPAGDGWLRLQNKNQPGGQPGKFIDASQPCVAANGENIQLWSFEEDRCQQFRLQPVGDVLLVNAGSGKVLDVAGCGNGTGVNVVQRGRRESDCQLWRFTPTQGAFFHIVNEKSGRPLTIAGCGGDGMNIVVKRRGGDACAQWRLDPLNDGSALIDGGSFRLVNRSNQQVVGVNGCATAVNVRSQPWTGRTCQRFKIVIP